MNRRSLITSALIIGAAGFGGATWYATRPRVDDNSMSSEQAEALIRPYSPILGAENAPVTIVEFFDPACEACRAFHPIVKDILASNEGMVRVVIRYTPFHGEASVSAIRVLEAARMQGVFEEVLDALLQEQRQWASHGNMEPDMVLDIAVAAGLDGEAARSQMLAPQTTAILNQDSSDVQTVDIQGTPTFFVNGRPLNPFSDVELRRMVAAEVARVGA